MLEYLVAMIVVSSRIPVQFRIERSFKIERISHREELRNDSRERKKLAKARHSLVNKKDPISDRVDTSRFARVNQGCARSFALIASIRKSAGILNINPSAAEELALPSN